MWSDGDRSQGEGKGISRSATVGWESVVGGMERGEDVIEWCGGERPWRGEAKGEEGFWERRVGTKERWRAPQGRQSKAQEQICGT